MKLKNEFFITRMYSSYKKVSHEQLYPFLRNWCRLTNRILGEREVLSVEVRVINEHFAEHLGLICLESLLGLTKIITIPEQCHTSLASVHNKSFLNMAAGLMLGAGGSLTLSDPVAWDQNFSVTIPGSEDELGKLPPKNIGDCWNLSRLFARSALQPDSRDL